MQPNTEESSSAVYNLKRKVPLHVTRVVLDASVLEIGERTFKERKKLIQAEINFGLQVIGEEAFLLCIALAAINFPSTLQHIQSRAFKNCQSLLVVKLPAGLQSIGEAAFSSCTSLTTVDGCGSLQCIKENAFSYCEMLSSFTFSETLTVIEASAFFQCTRLPIVNFPPALQEIRSDAFHGCESLAVASFSQGIRTIGSRAFNGCCLLERLEIPSTVVVIEQSAFCNCRGLRYLELNEGLEEIKERAFSRCHLLKHIKIPSTTRVVESSAFSCSMHLLTLELAEGLQKIGRNAFGNSENLINVLMPSTLETYYEREFEYASKLQKLSPHHDYFPQGRSFFNGFYFDYMNEDRENTTSNSMVNTLKTRFDGLPVHQLCYSQAYNESSLFIENLGGITVDGSVDALGMTVFHILALSSIPNYDLFFELMERCESQDIVCQKDIFGNPPLHYLCMNESADSLPLIKYLIQVTVTRRLRFLRLRRWKVDISQQVFEFHKTSDSSERISKLERIHKQLENYERLEGIALIEEFLWKNAVDEVSDQTKEMNRKKPRIYHSKSVHVIGRSIDREACRIRCGAHVVILHTLPFLGNYLHPN